MHADNPMLVEEKRTKIIATIGPASSSVSMLTRMMKSGMNVCRLNFSHGSHFDHKQLIKHIRTASRKSGKTVAILQDLQGPKIRLGELPESGVKLTAGKTISFSTAIDVYEAEGHLPVTYKQLHKDVKVGNRMLMDDGLLEAVCTRVSGRVITAKVVEGGLLKSHKGLNLPDSKISTSSFTNKDHEDLLFGIEHEVDWIALSFVTSRDVVDRVRKIAQTRARALGVGVPKILAKIERREAVDKFPDILDAVDGVMIARGDLGIEIPFEEVPIIQKELVEACREVGKPVVVATHMLESMQLHPRATRAEVSDVANAVIDHADAVMLSGESATGKYPAVAVQTMAKVVQEIEASRLDDISFYQWHSMNEIEEALAQTVHIMAEHGQIHAVAISVTHGMLAQYINRFRPNIPIYAACPSEAVARQLVLRTGITPMVLDDTPASFVLRMERKLRGMKLIKKAMKTAYLTSASNGEIQMTIR